MPNWRRSRRDINACVLPKTRNVGTCVSGVLPTIRIRTFPAHYFQLRMLLRPPGDLLRRKPDALHQRASALELKTLVAAITRICDQTNRQDEVDKIHWSTSRPHGADLLAVGVGQTARRGARKTTSPGVPWRRIEREKATPSPRNRQQMPRWLTRGVGVTHFAQALLTSAVRLLACPLGGRNSVTEPCTLRFPAKRTRMLAGGKTGMQVI